MSASNRSGVAHSVFFTLKESSEESRESLVAACLKYLSGHPGEVHFSVGTRAHQYDRPVNDSEFDVALLIVFATAADHDAYQVAERHQQFINEQSAGWENVRVFDSIV